MSSSLACLSHRCNRLPHRWQRLACRVALAPFLIAMLLVLYGVSYLVFLPLALLGQVAGSELARITGTRVG